MTSRLGEKVYVVGAIALALSFIFKNLELIKESEKSFMMQS